MATAIPTKPLELMLAGWSLTHNGGCKVTFWLSDEDDLKYFEAATVRKGKVAGQRYQTVFVQLNDDDTPDQESLPREPKVELKFPDRPVGPTRDAVFDSAKEVAKEPKYGKNKRHIPDGLCGLAIRWCDDDHFNLWLEESFPAAWATTVHVVENERAKSVVCNLCGISSRKELDTNSEAKEEFKALIMVPYVARRKEDGVDEGNF